MKAKRKGSRQELKSIKLLEDAGHYCTKAGGSLGVFDIIALHKNGVRCIQVKSNCWPGPTERESMAATRCNIPDNATIECWRWNDYKRKPMIKLIEEF